MKGQDRGGMLVKPKYGTRDAILNFEKDVQKFMQSQGFIVRVYNYSTDAHRTTNIQVMLHGEDFTGNALITEVVVGHS